MPRRRRGGDLCEQLVGVLVPRDAEESVGAVEAVGALLSGAQSRDQPQEPLGRAGGGTAPPARGGSSPPGGDPGGIKAGTAAGPGSWAG